MAHMAGYLTGGGLAGVIKIMAFRLQANRYTDCCFKVSVIV
jgi:hypothetical protein